jgi:type I restriction enzyme R subunit
MIEFKQIIGRGTRLFDGKNYFTIYDFVGAYQHFNDPEWDGEPEAPTPITPREKRPRESTSASKLAVSEVCPERSRRVEPRPQKIKIKLADGKEREIQHTMATSFWSADGKPLSATEFIERLFGYLPELFKNASELRELWSLPDTREKLLKGLAEKGYGSQELTEISRIIDAEKSDIYDVLAYIAYASTPMTRRERVIAKKRRIFSKYNDKQQEFLDFILDQYMKEGINELNPSKLPQLIELKYRAIHDAVKELGRVADIRQMFIGFQRYLYEDDAVA